MKIFVIIPAFNEEARIGGVIKDVKTKGYPIIVVDDGSKDATYKVAKRFKGIRLLRHRVNLGKGAAIKTGCKAAFALGADAVVLMDSDGQHKAEDLDEFKKHLETGIFDIVLGSRNLSMGVPLVRYMGNKFASFFVSFLFGIYVTDLICGYRGFTRQAFEKMDLESQGYAIETEMVVKTKKNNLKHCEVPVKTVYYDEVKGVTILDAFGILLEVIRWRLTI